MRAQRGFRVRGSLHESNLLGWHNTAPGSGSLRIDW
ncbi:hypothetical protein GGD63_004230 [Bradyrhizobium sp. cir1]|nr:hypothetical protein [Bradyrhizobium sp. cir1]